MTELDRCIGCYEWFPPRSLKEVVYDMYWDDNQTLSFAPPPTEVKHRIVFKSVQMCQECVDKGELRG